MPNASSALSATARLVAPEVSALGKDDLISFLENLLCPLALVASLWTVALICEGELLPMYLMLSVVVFAIAYPSEYRIEKSWLRATVGILLNWIWTASLVFLLLLTTGYLREFPHRAVVLWLWLAPLTELLFTALLRSMAPAILALQGPRQRAIILGMNEQGIALANRCVQSRFSRIELCGFVDGRTPDRLPKDTPYNLLGDLTQLADLVREKQIQLIYLSLPMAAQPRILHILDALKDTTASIYFVPNMFVTDLIQGRTSSVCGTPVISVCETPFLGINGLLKRGSDIVLSALILLLISPLLLGIAIAVKRSSPGPVIFRQRRYGLDGGEIVVYKFRSMTVAEDGQHVQQAQRNDQRITPLGAFLRKTSLDELPQFINVLQGRMSIVGPRPHAVAHNELYRKLIKGYMVRHKVKPGITGWAQVNGYRGETDTLEKMQHRIDFDLNYLRNWSLRLDLHIIVRTAQLVLRDDKAY